MPTPERLKKSRKFGINGPYQDGTTDYDELMNRLKVQHEVLNNNMLSYLM